MYFFYLLPLTQNRYDYENANYRIFTTLYSNSFTYNLAHAKKEKMLDTIYSVLTTNTSQMLHLILYKYYKFHFTNEETKA
jgi:hypothetical protein